MNKSTILKAGEFDNSVNQTLGEEFNVIDLPPTELEIKKLLMSRGPEISGIAVRTVPIDKECMELLPSLKVISSFSAGINNIDINYARSKNIDVKTTSSVLADDVADLVVALVINLIRKIPQADCYIRKGKWIDGKGVSLTRSLSKMNIGIVGLGVIGGEVARRFALMCDGLYYYGPHEKDVEWNYCNNLRKMAEIVDVLILTCPLNKSTRYLVNAEVLDALGSRGYLVNVARGAVVNEAALVDVIKDGKIAGAALDVFEHEPVVPDELINSANVILTPHIGSGTEETRRKMGEMMIHNLRAVLA